MSIYAMTGVPGSGKSIHSVRVIRYALDSKRPRPVIANFEIATEYVRYPELFFRRENADITPEFLEDFSRRFWASGPRFQEDYLTLVLDECQQTLNCRNWRDSQRMGWLSFFSQHRKMGYRILLVTQSLKMLDNQIRMNVEYEASNLL